MIKVVVTGAAGAIGSRVVRRLADAADILEVLAVDRVGTTVTPDVESKRVDLAAGPLDAVFSGADVVVHLASAATPGHPEPAAEELDLAITRRVLDAATEAGVPQVVVLSPALAYGALAANPVPITEAERIPDVDEIVDVHRAPIKREAPPRDEAAKVREETAKLLATLTTGFSGADIAYLCAKASQRAFRDAVEMNWVRSIELDDFKAVLAERRPSVTPAQLRKYESFRRSREGN